MPEVVDQAGFVHSKANPTNSVFIFDCEADDYITLLLLVVMGLVNEETMIIVSGGFPEVRRKSVENFIRNIWSKMRNEAPPPKVLAGEGDPYTGENSTHSVPDNKSYCRGEGCLLPAASAESGSHHYYQGLYDWLLKRATEGPVFIFLATGPLEIVTVLEALRSHSNFKTIENNITVVYTASFSFEDPCAVTKLKGELKLGQSSVNLSKLNIEHQLLTKGANMRAFLNTKESFKLFSSFNINVVAESGGLWFPHGFLQLTDDGEGKGGVGPYWKTLLSMTFILLEGLSDSDIQEIANADFSPMNQFDPRAILNITRQAVVFWGLTKATIPTYRIPMTDIGILPYLLRNSNSPKSVPYKVENIFSDAKAKLHCTVQSDLSQPLQSLKEEVFNAAAVSDTVRLLQQVLKPGYLKEDVNSEAVDNLKAVYVVLLWAYSKCDQHNSTDRWVAFFSIGFVSILPSFLANPLIRSFATVRYKENYLFPCMRDAVNLSIYERCKREGGTVLPDSDDAPLLHRVQP